jgi:hypothetical protein
VVDQFERVVRRAEVLADKKSTAANVAELREVRERLGARAPPFPCASARAPPRARAQLEEKRKTLKDTFIQQKQACTTAVEAVVDDAAREEKTTRLNDLKERYRRAREEYKALGLETAAEAATRDELLSGASARADARRTLAEGGSRNDALLDSAADTAIDTTAKLRAGLAVINEAQETAEGVATTLREDREKIERIGGNLDEIQSDLVISQRLLTNLIKRLYTDKVIIAFTCLLVCAIVGIIAYAKLKPDQKTFSVPDEAQPPTSTSRALRGGEGGPAARWE